jgi:hypothetical protein
MQGDTLGANPIFTPAGEAVLLWIFLGTAGAVVLAALWHWRRTRRR